MKAVTVHVRKYEFHVCWKTVWVYPWMVPIETILHQTTDSPRVGNSDLVSMGYAVRVFYDDNISWLFSI